MEEFLIYLYCLVLVVSWQVDFRTKERESLVIHCLPCMNEQEYRKELVFLYENNVYLIKDCCFFMRCPLGLTHLLTFV